MVSLIAPADWVGDRRVLFRRVGREHELVADLCLAANGKAEGSAQKLTSGTSVEAKPSVFQEAGSPSPASRRISISGACRSRPTAATSAASPQQVTGSAFDAHTSVSADGKKLVFISTRSGNPDVWMKDLESGKETALTATPSREEAGRDHR